MRSREAAQLHSGDEVTIRGAVYRALSTNAQDRTVEVCDGPDGYLPAVPWRVLW